MWKARTPNFAEQFEEAKNNSREVIMVEKHRCL
jgi:hypothetical protein